MRSPVRGARSGRRTQPGSSSSERLPRDRHIAQGEVRIDPKCPAERRVAVRRPAETELDYPAVEDPQGVARAEPKRAPRMLECLSAATVLVERPRKDVVSFDRLPFSVGI